MRVVPDASVILKWVLPDEDEPDGEAALSLRDAIRDDNVSALVPSLWWYEVGNVIARRYPDDAEAWFGALSRFGLQEVASSQSWIGRALAITRRFDVTFYDAAYHAIALEHQAIFVTADERYVARVAKAGGITRLSDWRPPPAKRRR